MHGEVTTRVRGSHDARAECCGRGLNKVLGVRQSQRGLFPRAGSVHKQGAMGALAHHGHSLKWQAPWRERLPCSASSGHLPGPILGAICPGCGGQEPLSSPDANDREQLCKMLWPREEFRDKEQVTACVYTSCPRVVTLPRASPSCSVR